MALVDKMPEEFKLLSPDSTTILSEFSQPGREADFQKEMIK
jgi:hypothetical protein